MLKGSIYSIVLVSLLIITLLAGLFMFLFHKQPELSTSAGSTTKLIVVSPVSTTLAKSSNISEKTKILKIPVLLSSLEFEGNTKIFEGYSSLFNTQIQNSLDSTGKFLVYSTATNYFLSKVGLQSELATNIVSIQKNVRTNARYLLLPILTNFGTSTSNIQIKGLTTNIERIDCNLEIIIFDMYNDDIVTTESTDIIMDAPNFNYNKNYYWWNKFSLSLFFISLNFKTLGSHTQRQLSASENLSENTSTYIGLINKISDSINSIMNNEYGSLKWSFKSEIYGDNLLKIYAGSNDGLTVGIPVNIMYLNDNALVCFGEGIISHVYTDYSLIKVIKTISKLRDGCIIELKTS